MRIQYNCHFAALTGYARAAQDYIQALIRNTDARVYVKPFYAPDLSKLEARYADLEGLVGSTFDPVDIDVFHASAHALATHPWPFSSKAPVTVAVTTWETSFVPEEVAAGLKRYSAVIVPSSFNYKVMVQAGVFNCYVVPHCYDESFWQDNISVHDEFYRFYTVGAWSSRKNIDGLIRAYFSAFEISDNVALHIYSSNVDKNGLEFLLATSGVNRDNLPRLFIYSKPYDEEELRILHSSGIFVSATRSEGFGLGGFEAAISGRPVLMPQFGGQEEYLRYSPSHAVPYQLTPVFPSMRVNSSAQVIADFVHGTSCRQLWAEPDLYQMGEMMRFMYHQNLQKVQISPSMPAVFGYTGVSQLLYRKLGEIYGSRSGQVECV